MKIMMISSNTAMSPYPIYPLGLSVVSGALRAAGHEVRQYDFLAENSSVESVMRAVREFGPGMIGISIRNIDNVNFMNMQFYIDTVRDIVSAVRKVTDSRVVLGGAGFSLMPELILQRTGADFGIAGEGEECRGVRELRPELDELRDAPSVGRHGSERRAVPAGGGRCHGRHSSAPPGGARRVCSRPSARVDSPP